MIYYNTYPCFPLWADIVQSTDATGIAGLDRATVDVYLGEDTPLFSGVVVKRPGDTYLRVRLNDIVAPYVRAEVAGLTGDGCIVDATTMPLFKISWQGGTLVRRFYVFGDCSWDRSRVYESQPENPQSQNSVLSALIDGKVVRGQQVLFTSLLSSSMGAYREVTYHGQYRYALFKTVPRGEDTGTKGPGTFHMAVADFPDSPRGLYSFWFTNQDDPGGYYGIVEGVELVDVCARYVLYYLNAYGGWDWFVIQGRVTEKDSLTRTEYNRRPVTADAMSRGRDVLQVEVTKSLEMHTHWLTDDEASRVHHLTESPAVYVHDLVTDIISPAVLTGSTHENKTYKGQGGRLVSYAIQLDMAVAQTRQ